MEKNRRKFIKQVGALSAGVGLLSTIPVPGDAKELIEIDQDTIPEEHKSFTVTIYQTTDIHCQVHPHDELFIENDKPVYRKTGGYAHLSAYFKNERKKNQNTFFIDTGDMFQGSELSVKTTGKAIVPILNHLDYNLYLPGNWEVIYYKQAMQKLLGALNAPKVCANMYHDLGDGKRGELIFLPYYTWNINGFKIGFLGYTDPFVPTRQPPNYSKGILYSKPEENLAHYVDVLKNYEQCNYIFIIAHLGLSQQIALANLPDCKGVDYILGGDTHERVRTPLICKYSKVVEPGAFGSFVGKLKLTIDQDKVIKEEYELVEITADKFKEDKEVLNLISQNEIPFKKDIYEVVGYSRLPLYRYFVIENPIDTMILDALKWKLKDVDIVLSNGFRFCPPNTTPDHSGNIPITQGYIYDMLPVDSVIRKAQVYGHQIVDWLEHELNNVFAKNASERMGGWFVKFLGMEIRFKAFEEKGKRLQQVIIGGKPLDSDKVYSISACERDGDPPDVLCRMKGVMNPENTPFTLHKVMREYLKANSPVNPVPHGSAIVLDAPQSLLSQVTDSNYKFY